MTSQMFGDSDSSDMDISAFSVGGQAKADTAAEQVDCSQPYGDVLSEDDCELQDDHAARVFRAEAFLKRTKQEAAATQAHVFGLEQAATELSNLLKKRHSAVNAASKRLESLRSARTKAAAAIPTAAASSSSGVSGAPKHLSKAKKIASANPMKSSHSAAKKHSKAKKSHKDA